MNEQKGHMIAIGDGAIATEPYEMVVKVTGHEGRTILTPEEHAVISAVLRRMFDVPKQISIGYNAKWSENNRDEVWIGPKAGESATSYDDASATPPRPADVFNALAECGIHYVTRTNGWRVGKRTFKRDQLASAIRYRIDANDQSRSLGRDVLEFGENDEVTP